ncbi:MAG: trypsin-like peptidase domain-containing protein [Gemmatimonadaceae bacterium]
MTPLFGMIPLFGMTLLLLGCRETRESSAATLSQTVPAATVSESRRSAITRAVERVAPAVVTVQTEQIERVSDPFGEWFFGRSSSQSRVVPGLGSGFIVAPEGVVVTNAHVVANAQRVSVMRRDGKVHPAQVLGTDETNDIAVLKIDDRNLPIAALGNSSSVVIGEWAIAIGNPYGFVLGNSEPAVTAGVISGVGRNLIARGEGPEAYFDMIQTDASINPGNSGGPLVNADGEVIGVNSSIYSPSGGSVGIGFAIPINRVRRIVEDIVAHRAVRRPWIGVRLRTPQSANVREAISIGAIIASVAPESPAERAGLQPADVILQAGPRAIRNAFDWQAALLDLRVGDNVPLRIRRGTREFDANVRVQDLPEVGAAKVQVLRDLELTTVTPAIRAERGIRRTGALILRAGDRTAAELGVQPGDVIVQINTQRITTADEAKRALEYYGGRSVIQMILERGGGLYSTEFVMR